MTEHGQQLELALGHEDDPAPAGRRERLRRGAPTVAKALFTWLPTSALFVVFSHLALFGLSPPWPKEIDSPTLKRMLPAAKIGYWGPTKGSIANFAPSRIRFSGPGSNERVVRRPSRHRRARWPFPWR